MIRVGNGAVADFAAAAPGEVLPPDEPPPAPAARAEETPHLPVRAGDHHAHARLFPPVAATRQLHTMAPPSGPVCQAAWTAPVTTVLGDLE